MRSPAGVHRRPRGIPGLPQHRLAGQREVTEKFGGKMQGFRNYTYLNHTPAGYPNQFQHFCYDLYSGDPGLAAFAKENCPPQYGTGSAEEDQEAFHVTPYDIGWGYLVNMNHDFVGKEALMAAKQAQKKQMITLEWNADDVADVFASQFRGQDVQPYDPLEAYTPNYNGGLPIPTLSKTHTPSQSIQSSRAGRSPPCPEHGDHPHLIMSASLSGSRV